MEIPAQTGNSRSESGVVLIWTAVLIFAMFGMLGLGIDLGRLYIVKGELQNYTDAAAFAAAMELNGLDSGLTRARSAAADLPNKYDFGSKQVTSAQRTVAFGATSSGDANGNWSAAPPNADIPDIAYVRVGARVDVPLYFAPMVGAGYTSSVAAETVAGKETASSLAPGNLLPMAPMAANTADPSFGFVFGESYTLRWSSNVGNSNAPPAGAMCSGDLALGWGAGSTLARQRARDPLRGYWGSASGATLSSWIENGYSGTLALGDFIPVYTGSKNGRKNAMEDRVDSDDDHSSTTYTQYENNSSGGDRVGNGRRVVVVPVIAGTVTNNGTNGTGNGNGNGNNFFAGAGATPNFFFAPAGGNGNGNGNEASGNSGNGNGSGNGSGNSDVEDGAVNSWGNEEIIGFAAFFLMDLSYGTTNGNDPFCAEYIGTYTQGANATSGGKTAGVTKIRIVR